jgi:N-acetylglucosaminyldiphosphoundecaprenol N-acetyl-beta-D-mannosaminyltransferase
MRPEPEQSLYAQPGAVTTPATVDVLGVPLALTDYDEMLAWIEAMVASRERGYLCACNVHTVTASSEDQALRTALMSASINVPDGQPLVWAINALGHRLAGRVYGPELMSRATARAALLGHRLYLYGGRNQGALVQLALNLRRRHPGVKIVGGYSPPHRPLSEEERSAIVHEINHSGADVVWVGIGVPKQEKWMAEMRPLPARTRAAAALEALPALQPTVPRGVRAAARADPAYQRSIVVAPPASTTREQCAP